MTPRRAAWLAACVVLLQGCATAVASKSPPPAPVVADCGGDWAVASPREAAQGALVVITGVPQGSRLVLDERPLRVSAQGKVVFGIPRERTNAVRVEFVPCGTAAPRVLEIAVTDRDFPLERISGVPEDTVNPPPAIAERIADEQRQVASARTRDDARNDWDVAFLWPVTGRISGVFGSQRIYNGTPKSPHSGLDVAAPEGTPIRAPAAGIVTFADPDLYLTGGTVLIDHGHGLTSSFLHLSRIDVKVGERVEQGQPFALVGKTGRATGPHMHWGLNWFDTRVDPQLLVDPAQNTPR
jgi:murein DD-endopeptidase MepM/ murein hydrolase activator NlpD